MGLGRVELPTCGLGNRCSIHLSYRPSDGFYTDLAESPPLGLWPSGCPWAVETAQGRHFALDEPLVQVHTDCDSISGIPAVVHVIAVPGVIDIHIVVLIPVV